MRRWEEEKIKRSEDLKERRRNEWGSSIREDRRYRREDGKNRRIIVRKRRKEGRLEGEKMGEKKRRMGEFY